MTTVRMLATDLDGTLLRPDNTVSARTVAALAAAREIGFPVVFVTGRPPRWMPDVVAATGHGGVAVCANGALLIDQDAGTVLAAHPLAADVALDVARALTVTVPGATFAVEYVPSGDVRSITQGSGRPTVGYSPGYRPRLPPRHDPLVGSLAELVEADPVVKLLVRGPAGGSADELLALATALVGHRAEITHSSPDDPLLEISAPGVSKGTTLAWHAARLGLAAEQVATVGDMPNDVPMLSWAGTSYAVRGAHPAALAATSGRVLPPEDDGVARLLEALLELAVVAGPHPGEPIGALNEAPQPLQ
ncbi:MAG TPA: HAD family hydrolase [Candidatus Nanopelagicales bacterium]|jgi:hypothetical protein